MYLSPRSPRPPTSPNPNHSHPCLTLTRIPPLTLTQTQFYSPFPENSVGPVSPTHGNSFLRGTFKFRMAKVHSNLRQSDMRGTLACETHLPGSIAACKTHPTWEHSHLNPNPHLGSDHFRERWFIH